MKQHKIRKNGPAGTTDEVALLRRNHSIQTVQGGTYRTSMSRSKTKEDPNGVGPYSREYSGS